jgi:hypothetical protein
MKLRHLMTAALGGLVLSCQGPAAVLAREALTNGAASPHAAITEARHGDPGRLAAPAEETPRRIGA